LRNALVRDPVGVSSSARGKVSFNEPLSVLVIGDPGSRHPGARHEAEAVAELWRAREGSSVTTLVEDEATAEQVTQQLSTGLYDLIHFAGHAWADSEGAYLLLADEEPLRAASARSLFAARPPALLILNSHYTAFVPAGVHLPADPIRSLSALPASGHGRSGFIEAASLSGVASFVGCLGSASDNGSAQLGIRLHRELLAGHTIGQALLTARRELHQQESEYGDDWRQFVLSGSGDLRLPPG
jgi:CHAT domain-containing protein